jgi:hypothetical protein
LIQRTGQSITIQRNDKPLDLLISAAGPSSAKPVVMNRPELSLGSSPARGVGPPENFYEDRNSFRRRIAADREGGGFMAYGPRFARLYELLAQQAAKLLRGIKVADIPVEQPTKFELVINLKAAKAVGVTVPEALLVRADKVIE